MTVNTQVGMRRRGLGGGAGSGAGGVTREGADADAGGPTREGADADADDGTREGAGGITPRGGEGARSAGALARGKSACRISAAD